MDSSSLLLSSKLSFFSDLFYFKFRDFIFFLNALEVSCKIRRSQINYFND